MRTTKRYYICSAIIIFIYLFIRNRKSEFKVVKHENVNLKKIHVSQTENIFDIEREVTLLLRYTHETSKHLAVTVNSFSLQYPFLSIVIVSDNVISREITNTFSNTSKVINIPLKLDLVNLLVDRNVLHYIKTNFVFIAPVGVISLLPQEIEKLSKLLNRNGSDILAVAVEKKPLKCLKLDLNLIQWTIKYNLKGFGSDCDSFQGDHGIFLKTAHLKKIGEPFMLPFPEAFYIQTTLMKMKAKPLHTIKLISKYKESRRNDLSVKNQIQRQIMNKLFKIKKVLRENGVVEWYGCTRNTPRCFPNVVNSVPEYIHQGRWTPPCCLKVLRETVRHVFQVLKGHNVRFWLEGGSLLGAMRMKDIIPWDYDVDVGAYLEDIDKCPWLKIIQDKTPEKNKLPSATDDQGFVWEKASPEEGDFYRVQASTHNRLHVDIFPFYSKNGIMTKKTWFPGHPQDMEFPEHYLNPLTTIEFAGIQAPAPNNMKEFLELKFGQGCVENPQYPNPKLFPFPESIKQLVVNETYSYDFGGSV